jgi:hypothetical protein
MPKHSIRDVRAEVRGEQILALLNYLQAAKPLVDPDTADVLGGELEVTALQDGSTVTIDASKGKHFSWTIAGNRTLATPTNGKPGQTIYVLVTQSGSSNTITFSSAWRNVGQRWQPAQQSGSKTVLRATLYDSTWYYSLDHSRHIAVTTTQITGNVTQWAPDGLSYADVLRASTDASRNMHGIRAPDRDTQSDSFRLVLTGSNDLVLKHESATATAADRLYIPGAADLTLSPFDVVGMFYDFTAGRWRVC